MQKKLMIVTDLGQLKAYEVQFPSKGSPRIETLEEQKIEAGHQRVVDQVTDLAGRHGAPTHGRWASPWGDAHNLELETERRLVKQIAQHITRLVQTRGQDGCWLATPKTIERAVLDELSNDVRKHIEKHVPRDLVKAEKKELLEVFLEGSSAAGGAKA